MKRYTWEISMVWRYPWERLLISSLELWPQGGDVHEATIGDFVHGNASSTKGSHAINVGSHRIRVINHGRTRCKTHVVGTKGSLGCSVVAFGIEETTRSISDTWIGKECWVSSHVRIAHLRPRENVLALDPFLVIPIRNVVTFVGSNDVIDAINGNNRDGIWRANRIQAFNFLENAITIFENINGVFGPILETVPTNDSTQDDQCEVHSAMRHASYASRAAHTNERYWSQHRQWQRHSSCKFSRSGGKKWETTRRKKVIALAQRRLTGS